MIEIYIAAEIKCGSELAPGGVPTMRECQSASLLNDTPPSRASSRRIAVPRKWLAYDYLRKQGLNNLYGVETPEQMMRLARLGRIEFAVADTLSIATLAREEGLAPSQLHYQMPLMKQGTYIAFSPQTDARQVARWQQALDEMNRDGRLEQLKQRWLSDNTPR